MVSTTRDLIAATYIQPSPDVYATELSLEGLGLARSRISKAAALAGHTVRLFGAIGHSAPKWSRESPDDEELTRYASVRVHSFRLVGYLTAPLPEHGLIAFDCRWLISGTTSDIFCRVKFRGWPWRLATVTELGQLLRQ